MQLQHKAYTLFVLVALSLGIPFSAISGTAATESSSSISNLFATRSAKIAGVSGIGATAFAVLCLKAHKKMVAAETVNPQSMLAQKARSRFEKLRATFLAFLLTATAAGTHAYMSPASDDTATDLAAAKPSLTDDKSGDKATVPGTITPPPSAKGAGVVKKKATEKDKGLGGTKDTPKPPVTRGDAVVTPEDDDSEADEDDDDSGEESEEEIIEPEKPLSAAEKAERVAQVTAHSGQLKLQINELEQRRREIDDAIYIEMTAKMQAARDALATHDGYQAWLTGPGDPQGPEKVAALNALRQRDSALDQNLRTLGIRPAGFQDEYSAATDQIRALRGTYPQYQGIQKSLKELHEQAHGLAEEMENLEVAGRATLKNRLKHCKERQERLTAQVKRLEPSLTLATQTYSEETLMKDEKVAASYAALTRSCQEFATKFEEDQPNSEDVTAYLNAPYHYGEGADEERLAAYESLEKLNNAFQQSLFEKLATADKDLKELYRQGLKLQAARKEQERLETQIALLEIEHRLAAQQAAVDAAQKAHEDLEAARELLTEEAKQDPAYANAPRRQAEARAVLATYPGFLEAYTATERDPDDYKKSQHFLSRIFTPLWDGDTDGRFRRAWGDIEAEKSILAGLRSTLEYTDRDYLAAQTAFQEAIDPEHTGDDLLRTHKNLLRDQQQYKAFLARRKI